LGVTHPVTILNIPSKLIPADLAAAFGLFFNNNRLQ
jgi:hypothetical protein